MNKYKIIVKSTDVFGIEFIKRIAELARKGATIDESHAIRNEFPHQAIMHLETDDRIETDMSRGIEVMVIREIKNREELEAMDWEDFKKLLREHFGIGGRDRAHMTQKYLKAVEEQFGVIDAVVEEVTT